MGVCVRARVSVCERGERERERERERDCVCVTSRKGYSGGSLAYTLYSGPSQPYHLFLNPSSNPRRGFFVKGQLAVPVVAGKPWFRV